MKAHSLICPHPGCDHRNRNGAQYCARCGRPMIVSPVDVGLSWAPMLAFFFCFLLMLPCWMSNFQPFGGVFLVAFPILGWMAFRPKRR